MHEHYDATGNRCRSADAFTTVVSREPEWDETSQGRALALDRHERSMCPCGCGQTVEDATDPNRAFRIDTYVCYARRALDRVNAKEKHDAELEGRPDGWDSGHLRYVDDSFVPEPKKG